MPESSTRKYPVFGRYRLLSLIGAGGYARVYRAEELDGAMRLVAVKMARDCGDGKSRKVVRALTNEAHIMSRLHHPNLVAVHEFGQISGRYYIAMELVAGLSVRDMLKRCARRGISFGPAAAMEVLRQVASALDHAHNLVDEDGVSSPVIHRDLKPANVMVTRKALIKVMDFGVAKWPLAEVSTTAGIIKGTPLYMAPEQVRARPVTPASDIFSLGTVLYQLLTHRPLFQADTVRELLRQVALAEVDEQLQRVPADSQALLPLLRRALMRDPAERFVDASEFIQALDAMRDQIEDDGNLSTLTRAIFGGSRTPERDPTPPKPSTMERVEGGDWSVRIDPNRIHADYEGQHLVERQRPAGKRS